MASLAAFEDSVADDNISKMTAKHFVGGSPAELVVDALESLAQLRPGIQIDRQHKSMNQLPHSHSRPPIPTNSKAQTSKQLSNY